MLKKHRIHKASRQDFYEAVHKIADKAEPAIRNEFISIINNLRDETSIKALEKAVQDGDLNAILLSLGVTEKLPNRMNVIIGMLRNVFEKTATFTLQTNMPRKVVSSMSFDLLNPRSVNYIQQSSGRLITNITSTTRESVRQLLTTAFEEGIPPRQLAGKIKDLVGLTPRQTTAVENFKSMLISEGNPPGVVERRVKAYRNRLLKQRAINIARTETIQAANAGQLELWRQAADKGLIEHTAKKKWLVTKDDRLCHICKPIPGNNTDVGLNGLFQTSVGPKEHPPAHPQCRCSMRLSS